MDSFSTLRSILQNAPTPSDLHPSISPSNSTCTKRKFDSIDDHQPKHVNKRKAAFEAWHQKKLAQMKNGDSQVSRGQCEIRRDSESELKRVLLNPPTLAIRLESPSIVQTNKETDIGKQNGAQLTTAATARTLTTPKLSRHNDAAFYPNIQCILCHEWVCSRNRYMHIESHFQYRPYKCSVCGYDNRKQIFIELHISRVHKGAAKILYHPDSELEKRAWTMAERCLQHTREVLLRRQMDNANGKHQANLQMDESSGPTPSTVQSSSKCDNALPLAAPYAAVYRPKIYNNQRSEKSNLIEESRLLGLIPDFSEITAREEKCGLCDTHVLRTPALLEEHARTHLSRASYSCSMVGCAVVHHSRNFITRHMKEVHRIRKGINDILEQDGQLLQEYLTICCRCFPHCFASTATAKGFMKDSVTERLKSKLGGNFESIHRCDSDSKSPTTMKEESKLGANFESILQSNIDSKSPESKLGANFESILQSNADLKLPVKEESTFGGNFESIHRSNIDSKSPESKLGANFESILQSNADLKLPVTVKEESKFGGNLESIHQSNIDPKSPIRGESKFGGNFESIHRSNIDPKSLVKEESCLGCIRGLNLFPEYSKDGKCVWCRSMVDEEITSQSILISVCQICNEVITATDRSCLMHKCEAHSMKHVPTTPFLCEFCTFSHWNKIEFDRHYQQNHPKKKSLLNPSFQWRMVSDWRDIWKRTFSECFSKSNDPEKYIQCGECTTAVLDTALTRFQHISARHCSNSIGQVQFRIRCIFCSNFDESDESQLTSHTTQSHSDHPSIICISVSFNRETSTGQCLVFDWYRRCFKMSQSSVTAISKRIYCQLCHTSIVDDAASHLVHLQYHSTAPIYRCRACLYMDVDVDRMKGHVDDTHDGKVPYYAETLPFDQESKALRLMQLCFKLGS